MSNLILAITHKGIQNKPMDLFMALIYVISDLDTLTNI